METCEVSGELEGLTRIMCGRLASPNPFSWKATRSERFSRRTAPCKQHIKHESLAQVPWCFRLVRYWFGSGSSRRWTVLSPCIVFSEQMQNTRVRT